MQISHQFDVNATREQAFAFLWDVRSMAPCLPGCRDLTEAGPDRYAAVIEVSVAFLKLKFDVQVEVVEAEAPSRLTARITGKPMSLAGQMTALADLTLTELTGNRTALAYSLEVSMTGRLGAVGQSAFRAKGEELGQLFARNLKAALEGHAAEATL